MEAQTAVALGAAALAAIVAVAVPWMTFRLALRQDQLRWLREQRAQLYIELLTEAYAEKQDFHHQLLDDETRARSRYTDLRLPPLERARLGARSTIYASKAITRLFNQLQHEAASASLAGVRDHNDRLMARVHVDGAFDALQDAIRHELGADLITLEPRPAAPSAARQPVTPGSPRRPSDPARSQDGAAR
jgi:hypothetical protein